MDEVLFVVVVVVVWMKCCLLLLLLCGRSVVCCCCCCVDEVLFLVVVCLFSLCVAVLYIRIILLLFHAYRLTFLFRPGYTAFLFFFFNMDSYFPFIAYHQFEDSKGASRSCQSKKG